MKYLQVVLVLALLLLMGPAASGTQAQPARGDPAPPEPNQILPPVDENLCPGEILPFQLTIYPPSRPAKGDILFAFDTTASMGGVISSAQENAVVIMNDLNRLISDVRFGVVDIEDYPIEPYGAPGDNQAYRLTQPLTTNRDAVRAAINSLAPNSGGDFPEAYTRAIHEAHADPQIGWREDARRLLLMFGDSVPHDDALNEGIGSPPYRPPANGMWETGHPPSFLDPGRDGVPGTRDDLDLQVELARLTDNDISLLHVVTSSTFIQPDQADLVIYWNTWATSTGGKAVPLWNARDLPELIRQLVEDTVVGVIKRLTLHTAPASYGSWVEFNPAEIRDIPIPSDGALSFLGRVKPPPDARAGTYHFRIIAIGDGIEYGEKPITITVPEWCFPEPDFEYWYYLPLIRR